MLELYQAYGNYESMMDLAEAIVINAVRAVGESLTLQWGDSSVDYTPPGRGGSMTTYSPNHAGCPSCEMPGPSPKWPQNTASKRPACIGTW